MVVNRYAETFSVCCGVWHVYGGWFALGAKLLRSNDTEGIFKCGKFTFYKYIIETHIAPNHEHLFVVFYAD